MSAMVKARVLVAASGVVALLVAIQSPPPKKDRAANGGIMHRAAPAVHHPRPGGRTGSAKGAEPAPAERSQAAVELAGEVLLSPSAAH